MYQGIKILIFFVLINSETFYYEKKTNIMMIPLSHLEMWFFFKQNDKQEENEEYIVIFSKNNLWFVLQVKSYKNIASPTFFSTFSIYMCVYIICYVLNLMKRRVFEFNCRAIYSLVKFTVLHVLYCSLFLETNFIHTYTYTCVCVCIIIIIVIRYYL